MPFLSAALFCLVFVAALSSRPPALWGRPARPLGDHTTRLCAHYKVHPPPELSHRAALIAAEAAHLIKTRGHQAAMKNTTFMEQVLPLLTKEERERLSYEIGSTAIYLKNESFIHKKATKVRGPALRGRQGPAAAVQAAVLPRYEADPNGGTPAPRL